MGEGPPRGGLSPFSRVDGGTYEPVKGDLQGDG